MIVLGGIMVVAGVAMLVLPDLNGAGWSIVAAGLLAGGFGYWFHVRGGNVPHPPRDLPSPPEPAPASAGKSCPACGSGSVRPMDGAETTAFYGYDRFVLVRPRICLVCGHEFEFGTVVVRGVSDGGGRGVGGAGRSGLDPHVALRTLARIPGHGVHLDHKSQTRAAAYGGVWWIRRSARVLDHYWRLRRPRTGGLKPVAVGK